MLQIFDRQALAAQNITRGPLPGGKTHTIMIDRNLILLLVILTIFSGCVLHSATSPMGEEKGGTAVKPADMDPLQLLLEHLRLSDRDLAICDLIYHGGTDLAPGSDDNMIKGKQC